MNKLLQSLAHSSTARRAFLLAALWGIPVSIFNSLQSLAHFAPKPHIRKVAELLPPEPAAHKSAAGFGPMAPILGRQWEGSLADGKLNASFSDASWFIPGSAELSDAGKQAALGIAQALRSLPLGPGQAQISIEAHSDSTPVVRLKAKYPTNWELSGARAFALVRELVSLGVESATLSGTGFADSRPISNDAAKNRRVVVAVSVHANWEMAQR